MACNKKAFHYRPLKAFSNDIVVPVSAISSTRLINEELNTSKTNGRFQTISAKYIIPDNLGTELFVNGLNGEGAKTGRSGSGSTLGEIPGDGTSTLRGPEKETLAPLSEEH